jgi:DNA-binding LacI/PurR family transcriptional regulator
LATISEDPPDGSRARWPVMKDVARLAGVSHQTVSRVVNGSPHVSPAARGRVQNAIKQLGYRPNLAARALVTRESMTLGVITVDTTNHGPASMLFGIEAAARAAGYFVTIATLRTVNVRTMREALDYLVAAGVDGVAVIAPVEAAVRAVQGANAQIPLVMVEVSGPEEVPSVMVDQVLGARLAVRHLVGLGHRHILHVSGPPRWSEAEARVRGWREELDAAGLLAHTVIEGDWSAQSGYRAAEAVLARPEATAVFAGNDQMALGLLKGLHDRGRSVPGDVSIVGFDDLPDSGFFIPALTTVRQDFRVVGRRCMEMLLALIRGERVTAAEPVAPELIVRQSTEAPRSGLVPPSAVPVRRPADG